jgi:hypothetical protein
LIDNRRATESTELIPPKEGDYRMSSGHINATGKRKVKKNLSRDRFGWKEKKFVKTGK